MSLIWVFLKVAVTELKPGSKNRYSTASQTPHSVRLRFIEYIGNLNRQDDTERAVCVCVLGCS